MITQTSVWLEPLTYWLRIEDLVTEPRIGDRLVEKADEGAFLLNCGGDLVRWIGESESLLQVIDAELRHTGGADYFDLAEIVMSMPQVESLQAVLGEVRGWR